jgi:flagellar FliL protein
MADAEGKDEDSVKGGMNKKLLMMGLLGLLVVGGGAGFFLMSGGEPEKRVKSEDVHAEAEAEAEQEADPGFIGPVIDLEPFVLNLADRDQLRYLKVAIKLQLDRPQEETDFTVKLPAIRDALLVLLTSKESRSLRTVDGKMLVRDEIGGRVNTIMKKGKIRQVFFTDFIIQ